MEPVPILNYEEYYKIKNNEKHFSYFWIMMFLMSDLFVHVIVLLVLG